MQWTVESYTLYDSTEPTTRSVSITGKRHQMLLLALGAADARDYHVTTATFDGQAMSLIGLAAYDGNDDAGCSLHYIDISGWPSGSYNLYYNVGTGGGPDYGAFAAVVISGGDGTDLLEDADQVAGVSTNVTRTLQTTKANTLLVDVLFTDGDNAKTVGAGQTQIFQTEPESAGNRFCMSYKVVQTVGNNTMSWTNSNDEYGYVAAAFNPAHNSGGGVLINSFLNKR